MPQQAFAKGNRRFFTVYSRAKILHAIDEKLSVFFGNLEQDINLSECPQNIFQHHMKNRDIQNNIQKIITKSLLNSNNLYDKIFVNEVLIDIFQRYSGEIGYDKYIDLWWRSKAEKRLYDQNYAEANHG